jgi:CDP-glucose 4,6-dehydratase
MESVGIIVCDLNFYKNKKVFITGHTGFKGSWLCQILINAGAEITGYSLNPPTTTNLYTLAEIDKKINSVIGDVRDIDTLMKTFEASKPEIVFHLAAQPLVKVSYQAPAYTYETNVMGTVNILECVRNSKTVKSFLNITTDKVYKNNEWEWGYRESEPLDGFDPYSNSKSCSELVTHSYKQSFFSDKNTAISTARAGNVIGGGDFADNRIIPDCIRAVCENKDILVRNPNSIRPYQHVLEPLFAYLLIAEEQYKNKEKADWYNVGPDECDCITTGSLVDVFCEKWGKIKWTSINNNGPHEANFLKLDCSRIKQKLDWRVHWHINEAIQRTIEFTKVYLENGNISNEMDNQIKEFMKG